LRKSAVAAAAVLATVGVSAQAGASTDANLLIRPAQGIGKIRLGMTEVELRRAMGKPRAVIRRPSGFGLRSVEFQWGLAAYTARLSGRPGRLRVVRVATTLLRERTRAAIGAGSREQAVLRAYPNARCEQLRTYRIAGVVHVGTTERDCTLFAPSGRRTTFTSLVRLNATIGESLTLAGWRRRARVVEVSVAEPS
jgi:hypothetical protein